MDDIPRAGARRRGGTASAAPPRRGERHSHPQQRQDGERLRGRLHRHVPCGAGVFPRAPRGRRRDRRRHGRHREDVRAGPRGTGLARGVPRLQGRGWCARGADLRVRQPRPPRVEVAPAGGGRQGSREGRRRAQGRDRRARGRGVEARVRHGVAARVFGEGEGTHVPLRALGIREGHPGLRRRARGRARPARAASVLLRAAIRIRRGRSSATGARARRTAAS